MRNRNGFSLIELLILSGIISILAIGIGTLMASMNRMVAQTGNSGRADSMAQTIETTFSFPGVCQFNIKTPNFATTTFNVASPGTINVTSLDMPSNATFVPILSLNQNIGKSFWLKQMFIRNITRLGMTTNFSADLVIRFSRDTPPAAAANGIETRTLPMALSTTIVGPTATITNCSIGSNPPPPGGPEIFAGWPNALICDGAVFRIQSPGAYYCHEGGATSTRSAVVRYNTTTKAYIAGSYNNSTTMYCGTCGACCSQSIDQLITNGFAKY